MNRVLAELKSLFDNALSSKFTEIYQGEVVLPPQSYLPCLMLIPQSTEVIAKSTAKDQYTYTILLRAVVDIKKYFDEAGTGDVLKAQQALINLMEERETTGVLKTATVLGVLRANITGTDYLFNNEITIQYSTIQTGEWFYWKAECLVKATTDLLVRP